MPASQGSIEKIQAFRNLNNANITICKVSEVHMDRGTVDVITNTGMPVKNIPVMLRNGLNVDEEVWGELELPDVDSQVVVAFIDNNGGQPFVLGSLMAWGYSKYQSDQVPAVSADKQFTLKLLEDIDSKTYRKIFKSGTTVEVGADGTLTLELPSGTYIKVDEDTGTVNLEDQHGNIITIDDAGIIITDGVNTNTITMDSSGMKLEDTNGNDITMGTTSVTINGNFEVLQ